MVILNVKHKKLLGHILNLNSVEVLFSVIFTIYILLFETKKIILILKELICVLPLILKPENPSVSQI